MSSLVVDLHEDFLESLLELLVGARGGGSLLLLPVQLLFQVGDLVLQAGDRRTRSVLVLLL